MENRIIDFRCRPPYGDFLKGDMYNGYALEYNAHWGDEPSKPLLDKSMESMIEEMDNGGVRYGVAASRPWAGVTNESVCALAEEYPDRFIALAAINGENPFVKGIDDVLAPSMPGYELFVTATNRALKEKMIWGTCFPIGSGLKGSVQAIHDMGVSDEAFPYLMW